MNSIKIIASNDISASKKQSSYNEDKLKNYLRPTVIASRAKTAPSSEDSRVAHLPDKGVTSAQVDLASNASSDDTIDTSMEAPIDAEQEIAQRVIEEYGDSILASLNKNETDNSQGFEHHDIKGRHRR